MGLLFFIFLQNEFCSCGRYYRIKREDACPYGDIHGIKQQVIYLLIYCSWARPSVFYFGQYYQTQKSICHGGLRLLLKLCINFITKLTHNRTNNLWPLGDSNFQQVKQNMEEKDHIFGGRLIDWYRLTIALPMLVYFTSKITYLI